MASSSNPPVAPGPTTTEAFVTDRQVFWASFTRFAFRAIVAVAVLVILMAIFLA